MSISHTASLRELLREALVNSYACFPLGYIFGVLLTVQLVRRRVQHIKYVSRIVQKWYEKWRELISTEYFSQKIPFKPKSFQKKKTNGLKNSVQLQKKKHAVSPLVPFIDHWLLHLPPDLTFKNYVCCPHIVFMCFVRLSEKTKAIFSTIQHSLIAFHTRDGGCLLRGTDWMLKC